MNQMKQTTGSIVLLLLLLLAGCASGPDLRVGLSPSYPPLVFMKDGVLAGIEPDLARQLGKQTDRRIVYEIVPFDQLIPALQDGKIDLIMAGMSVTPERQQLISFADSYMKIGQMLLIREKDVKRFPNALFEQAVSVKVGVVKGTTGEQFALKTFAWGGLTHFDTTEAAVRALEEGGIDCFVHDAPTIWRFSADLATQRPGLIGLFEPLTDEPLAWAVRKTNQALLGQLNAELEKMRSNGTLQVILNKWIRTRVQVGHAGAVHAQ